MKIEPFPFSSHYFEAPGLIFETENKKKKKKQKAKVGVEILMTKKMNEERKLNSLFIEPLGFCYFIILIFFYFA